MDYEKAYKEAFDEATIAYKDEDKHLKAALERIFPVLKESKDKKIREGLSLCGHKVGDNSELVPRTQVF